jgi:hypothetical protein
VSPARLVAALGVGLSVLALAVPSSQGQAPRSTARPPRSVPAARTALVPFDLAPFPYDGAFGDTGMPFFDARDAAGRRRGHTTGRGETYWEDETYRDRRVLLHVPAGFDPGRGALIVVYFHGQGATLERDVLARQQVPRQVAESRRNAVLVAPQFAVDAADSSSGTFWRAGVFRRFLDEAATRLARLAGHPRLARAFGAADVVLVAYSGGYQPAAYALDRGQADGRLRGVILLDALYGHEDTFAQWIAARRRSAFLASISTESTREHQQQFRASLQRRGVPLGEELPARLEPGRVVLVDAGSKELHAELVTRGWMDDPIAGLLARVVSRAGPPAPPSPAPSAPARRGASPRRRGWAGAERPRPRRRPGRRRGWPA